MASSEVDYSSDDSEDDVYSVYSTDCEKEQYQTVAPTEYEEKQHQAVAPIDYEEEQCQTVAPIHCEEEHCQTVAPIDCEEEQCQTVPPVDYEGVDGPIVNFHFKPTSHLHPSATPEETREFIRYHLGYVLGVHPRCERIEEMASRFNGNGCDFYKQTVWQLEKLFGTVPGLGLFNVLHRKSKFAFWAPAVQGNLFSIMDLYPEKGIDRWQKLNKPFVFPNDRRKGMALKQRAIPNLGTIYEDDPPKRRYTELPEFYQVPWVHPRWGIEVIKGPIRTDFS